MNMLIETLASASSHPAIWVAVALIVLHGCYALYRWRRCPHLCRRARVSREQAEAYLANPLLAGTQFFLVMAAGIGAVLAGLALIEANVEPVYALLLVIAGVFVVQVEPARLRLRESIARVVAAEAAGPDAVLIAQRRLRDSYIWLVALNFVLAVAIAAGIAAF